MPPFNTDHAARGEAPPAKGSNMEISCRIDQPDQVGTCAFRFVVSKPLTVNVMGQRLHMVFVDRSDGLQLKAFGLDLIDVFESALMVIRYNVEGAAGPVGSITWD